MARTLLNSSNISGVQKNDIDTSTSGQALITKVIAGTNISISSTGIDAGTGDVTINSTASSIPAGATTQIQFNDVGVFAGDPDLAWDKTNNDLVLGGTDTGIMINGVTNEPASPPSNNLILYSRNISGRVFPKVKGPSGLDYVLQPSLWQTNVCYWTPANTTNGFWLGTIGAGAGTFTAGLPTDTNLYTSIKRGRWANVVTTTNQVLGQRNTEALFYRGSAVAGAGGFLFYTRCGFDVWTNGSRFFAGMHSGTTVISADPSALNNTVGFCVDAADNGLISFLTRGTAATKASTGLTITTNKGYDLYIFCSPGSSQYSWKAIDIVTGTEVSGVATLNLPTNNVKLTAGVLASNANVILLANTHLGINKIYVETDY